MKKIILAAFVVALSFSSSFAQKAVKQDKNGNFYEEKAKVDSMTDKTFTASNGKVYRVWVSAKGKYYCNVQSKKGTTYKRYLN